MSLFTLSDHPSFLFFEATHLRSRRFFILDDGFLNFIDRATPNFLFFWITRAHFFLIKEFRQDHSLSKLKLTTTLSKLKIKIDQTTFYSKINKKKNKKKNKDIHNHTHFKLFNPSLIYIKKVIEYLVKSGVYILYIYILYFLL